MDRLLHEIIRTAEHTAIYRMVGVIMRGHSLPITLTIGAVIVVACMVLLRPRRAR